MFSLPLSVLIRTLTLGVALLSLAPASAAQLPASPPIADPADTRFQSVTEDWTTPALNSSRLKPVRPLLGVVDDTHAGYTVELLQLQWRWGDPLDVYVMKPKGVKKPPVILNLYGYPADTDPYKNEIFQSALTKDGFAAVGFVSALTGHRYHARPMKQWFLSELQECLATSAHDVQMVLNYLAARADLLQLIQVQGDRCWRSCHRPRQLINRCAKATGMATGTQTSVDVEFEGAVGEQREGLRELSTGGEPSGGLLEDQPRGAHERPPVGSAATSFFFLRIDSPFISMR